jgi:VIT1/CCC1 family predicted Fe2+/Mn2+ transporter
MGIVMTTEQLVPERDPSAFLGATRRIMNGGLPVGPATHLAEELGISRHNLARPLQAAVSSAAAFSIGAGIPLLASSLANDASRIWVTIVTVFAALLGLGVGSARFGGAHPVRPVLRILLGGGAAMAFTMAIGSLFGATVG